MAAPITIKFQHKGVFRRVTVDSQSGPDAAFLKVKEAVQTVVPDFQGKIAWKDSDGDLILIESNEELKEAIRHTKQECLKIELIPANNAKKNENSADPQEKKTRSEFPGFPNFHCGSQGANEMPPFFNEMFSQVFGNQHQQPGKPSEEEILAHLQTTGKQIEGMIEAFMGVKVTIEVTKKQGDEKQENKPTGTGPSTSTSSNTPSQHGQSLNSQGTTPRPNLFNVLQQMMGGPLGGMPNMPMSFPQDQEVAQIQETMTLLSQMGYSDDADWLKELVTSKHGNIHAVLNAIHQK